MLEGKKFFGFFLACLGFFVVAVFVRYFVVGNLDWRYTSWHYYWSGNAEYIKGSGNVVIENRDLKNFNQIQILGPGDVFILQGESEGIKIEAEDNILPIIKSTVANGILELGIKECVSYWVKTLKYYISVKDLNSITLNGSSRLDIKKLNGNNLSLVINGSGSGRIADLTVNDLNVDINGSGRVKIQGKTEKQNISIRGAGRYDGEELKSKDCKVDISGSGRVNVFVSSELKGQVVGSGRVWYAGTPKVVNVSVIGSGKVGKI